MASMTITERAQHFLRILLTWRNKPAAIDQIVSELNGLVNAGTKQPLSNQEKLDILDELNRLANQQKNTTISIPCVTGFLVNNSPVCRAHSWRRSNQLRLTNGPKNAPVLPPLWPAARLLRNPLRVC